MVLGYQVYICFMIYNSRILAACSAPGVRACLRIILPVEGVMMLPVAGATARDFLATSNIVPRRTYAYPLPTMQLRAKLGIYSLLSPCASF